MYDVCVYTCIYINNTNIYNYRRRMWGPELHSVFKSQQSSKKHVTIYGFVQVPQLP